MTLHLVGIDPSLTGTGLAVHRPGDPVVLRTIGAAGKKDDPAPVELERIRTLTKRLLDAIRADAEDGDQILVAIEGPAFMSNTGKSHTRAGLWWMVYHHVSRIADVAVIGPTALKRYVLRKGSGPGTDKGAMRDALARNVPQVMIGSDDEGDALGLVCMLSREVGHPLELSVNRVQPAALEGILWPAGVRAARPTTASPMWE